MSTTLGQEAKIRLESVARNESEYKESALTIFYYMSRFNLFDAVYYDSDRILTLKDIEGLLFSGRLYMITEKEWTTGFILLTSIYPYRAEITFCTWPPFWGRKMKEKGRLLMKQLVDMPENKALLNLYGFISKRNKQAIRYAYSVGFKMMGYLENGYIDHKSNETVPVKIVNYSINRT